MLKKGTSESASITAELGDPMSCMSAAHSKRYKARDVAFISDHPRRPVFQRSIELLARNASNIPVTEDLNQ